MLADLLEKKVDKEPPVLNGVIGKELRIGDKGLELVDNHISKILSKENNSPNVESKEVSVIVQPEETTRTIIEQNSVMSDDGVIVNENAMDTSDIKLTNKRPAEDDIAEVEVKRPALANGNADSPKPESVDSSNGDDSTNVSVSATAANLYAALAADALEDEDEELLQQETTVATVPPIIEETTVPVQLQTAPIHQMYVSNQNDPQQLIVAAAPRQIIVSQGNLIYFPYFFIFNCQFFSSTNSTATTSFNNSWGSNNPSARASKPRHH